MTSKHTIHRSDDGYEVRQHGDLFGDPTYRVIARCLHEEDARLIAKAPEMVEVLRSMKSGWDCFEKARQILREVDGE